jgi:type IV secretory pathway TrbF-like protein
VLPFKRASVRYSTTPVPATPYQAAQQLWDERIGSSRVQAKNWRTMAFGSLGLAFTAAAGLIYQVGRSTLTPYVIEVDAAGEVRPIGPALEAYHLSDAQIAYHLGHFIRNVRAVPLDPIVLRESWLEAYDYASPRAAQTLNEYARASDPFGRMGQASVAVEIVSIVRASENSFQVRWIERQYVNGSLDSTERWTAILSILLAPPHDITRLRKNPLGIYVDGLDWSRELGTAASSGDTK